MKYFFIVSIGRCGTEFLANLLNSTNEAFVQHEPNKDDYHYLPLAYYTPDSIVLEKKLNKRFERYLKILSEKHKVYGEVNSLLRYHIDWLEKRFKPNIIHLVRDGRDFVRSTYNRTVYTGHDTHLPILPKNSDSYVDLWCDFTRFQKLCWYWNHTNEYLMNKVEKRAKFESILKNYESLKNEILDPISLIIKPEVYNSMKKIPINTRKKFYMKKLFNTIVRTKTEKIRTIPHWQKWDKKRNDQFWEICGETMVKLGYNNYFKI